MRAIAFSLLVLLAACTGDGEEPGYEARHLESLVLAEPPEGLTRDPDDAELDLDDVSAADPERRARFEEAGFLAAYEATFQPATPDPRYQGFILTSRAYLFSDPPAGLAALRATLASEGSQLVSRPALFPDRPGFTVRGFLDDALPPGVAIAWRKRNVVLLLAVVAVATVSETEMRAIARKIDTLEPPTGPGG